jgi:excinuclease UvrABC ATPase subunit
LEASTLTYAEIKAIASGNPAVMEKVKVDTEVRKLDQLRAAHVNQQHSIRLQLHRLPLEIAEAQRNLASVAKDIAKRDAHADDEFAMTVGNRVYSGKGAREEAAKALTYTCCPGATTPPCKCVAHSGVRDLEQRQIGHGV